MGETAAEVLDFLDGKPVDTSPVDLVKGRLGTHLKERDAKGKAARQIIRLIERKSWNLSRGEIICPMVDTKTILNTMGIIFPGVEIDIEADRVVDVVPNPDTLDQANIFGDIIDPRQVNDFTFGDERKPMTLRQTLWALLQAPEEELHKIILGHKMLKVGGSKDNSARLIERCFLIRSEKATLNGRTVPRVRMTYMNCQYYDARMVVPTATF